MGIFKERSIPRAKTWNMTQMQNAGFATVPSNQSANMPFSLSKLFNILQTLWNPLAIGNNKNHLLQTRSPVVKENSVFEENLGFIVDSFLTHAHPKDNHENKLGFSLLKSLEFANLFPTKVTTSSPECPEDLFWPNINCDFSFLDSKKKALFGDKIYFQPDLDLLQTEQIFPKRPLITTKTLSSMKNKVMEECKLEVVSCPYPIANSSIQECISSYPAINVISETVDKNNQTVCIKTSVTASICDLNSKAPTSDKTNCSLEILNQELVIRKGKKMTKLSKKRRRRQKKKKQVPENHNLKSEQKLQSKTILQQQPDSITITLNSSLDEDDFCIIFDDDSPKSPCKLVGSSVDVNTTSGEKFVDVHCKKDDYVHPNPILSFMFGHMSNSETEDESDSDSSCKNFSPLIYEETLDFEFQDCFMNNLSSVCFFDSDSAVCSITSAISVIDVSELSSELKNVNCQWQKETINVPCNPKSPTKVSFAPDTDLVSVFYVELYDRKGEWETYALERFRFRQRINDLEGILSPVLSQSHRDKIQLRLQVNPV